MEKKQIILPKLRYEGAPELDSQIHIGFDESNATLRNDDRDIVLDLSEQFAIERAECKRYKLYGKMKMIFRNIYCGTSPYDYLRERLALSGDGSDNDFSGFLPYNEFAFLRNDIYYELPEAQSVDILSGFTNFNLIARGSTEHQAISALMAPQFNWNIYLSYIYSHEVNFPMIYTLSGNTIPPLSFLSGDGIPFRVEETINSYILTSPVKHGMKQGEHIYITQNDRYFYINSVGNEIYRSEEYVVNILKSQTGNVTLSPLVTGKRCVDIKDVNNSTSEYYVHRHRTVTEIDDYVLDKVGFESPIWEDEQKILYENSAGENDILVVRNRMEAVLFDFKEPFVLTGITNNLGYTPTELYISIIFRNGNGFFNYPPKVGYSFHMHDTWIDEHFDGASSLETGLTYTTFIRDGILFSQGSAIPEGTELYGAFVEYNPKEMKERIISEALHKLVSNPLIFNHGQTSGDLYYGASTTNPLGILYQPHYRYKIRELSPYIESSDISVPIENLPENAIYFPEEKIWRWRDLYDDGYVDPDGYGTDYPFMNNIHYVHKNINFYLRNEQIYTNKKDAVMDFYKDQDQENCDVLSTAYMRAGQAPSPIPEPEASTPTSTPIPTPDPTPTVPISIDAYYISASGSDNIGTGTFEDPWFTLNKAWENVVAGDTIYVMGGTYLYVDEQDLSNKSGNINEYINVWAYPGQTPLINPHPTLYTGTVGITISNADYIHVRGLEISGYEQRTSDNWYSGIIAANVNNCIFELLDVHHNGFGMSLQRWTTTNNVTGNLFLNCDFHHNYDPLTAIEDNVPYGGADGLTIRVNNPNSINTIRGCRMYNNSDDGFDGWYNSGTLIFENCWAFNNGYREDGVTIGGDGNGFKMGPLVPPPWTGYENELKRTMYNCIAFNNRMNGFDQNAALCQMYFINNTSFNNGGYGFYMIYDDISIMTARNNISLGNQQGEALFNSVSIADHNTWDSPVTVTNADFISVSTTGTDGERNSDGSFPTLNFLKIAQNSDLIWAGTRTGLLTDSVGNLWHDPPSMGTYEYVGPSPIVPALTVSPSSQSVTSSSGTVNFNVSSNISWTATSNQVWCTVTSSGTGNGIITATYQANSTYNSRTATITVSGSGVSNRTMTLVQAAATVPVTGYYYVSPSPTGVDSISRNGSISQPWATLEYAITRVSGGSTIYMNTGYYTITNQVLLPESVSIMGSGRDLVTITMTYSSSYPCIKLESYGQWGNPNYGNQSISGIKFDGNLTGIAAIGVNFRSNVHIYNCEFVNFRDQAVFFNGQPSHLWSLDNPYNDNPSSDYPNMPDANGWCTGNRFYNNIVTNCARYVTSDHHSGALNIGTQDGIEIYGNNINSTSRYGYGIKFWDLGFNKNSDIHDNTIEVYPLINGVRYEFAIEIWWEWGGTRIYNNRINGALDLVHCVDAISAGYSVRVYDNNIGRNSTPISLERGILLEGKIEYVQIYRNHIHHVSRAIYVPRNNYSGTDRLYYVDINSNLMVNLGQTGTAWQTWGIHWSDSISNEATTAYFKMQNNVIHALPASTLGVVSAYGIMLPRVNRMNYVYVDNNIILNFYGGAIFGSETRALASNLIIRNNILFGNGYSNGLNFDTNFTNTLNASGGYVYSGTIPNDPQFVAIGSDFHLRSTSPGYRAGVYVGLVNDYDEIPWNNPPSIGAYEYVGAVPPAPTLTVSPSNQNVTSSSGTISFNVSSNITWTATSNQSWCTVTSSGTGNGTIVATYQANAAYTSRTTTITVSGLGVSNQTVTVTQAAAIITPTLTVSPSSQNVTSSSGTVNFSVSSNISWTAVSNQSWCTVTSSGTGNGTLVATYQANATYNSRTVTITVSGSGVSSQTTSIVQAAATIPEPQLYEYYVKNTGNDSLDGRSDATAWRTISRVNSASLSPGSVVYFKRGDTWREEISLNPSSGTASGYVTISAYGTGSKPKILGSTLENSTSDWVNIGTNLWRNSDSSFASVNMGNLIFNNEASYGRYRTSQAQVVNQGDFFFDVNNRWIILYSVGNPATVYTNIECALDRHIVDLGTSKHHLIFENLDMRYGAGHGISGYNGCYSITIRDCDFSFIGGGYFEDGAARYGNAIQFWQSSDNIIVERNTFDNIYDAAITPQYAGSGVANITNWHVRSNIINRSEYSWEFFTHGSTGTISNIFFQNNTCLNAGGGFGHNQRPDGVNGRHVMIWGMDGTTRSNVWIRNNIFNTATESAIHIATGAEPYVNFDYNSYNVATVAYNGTTYTTLTSWQGHRSDENNSISGTPGFVSSTNYHLTSTASVIGRGLNVGYVSDFDRYPWRNPPSMGAYEFVGVLPEPTSPPSELNYYYVSTSGVDTSSRNGSSTQPWASLSYAASRVTTPGHTIYVNSGNYTEYSQVVLREGVNILGQSEAGVVITCAYVGSSGESLIKLETANGWLGVYGNQSISNLTINGNYRGYGCIRVNFRSNVRISHLTIRNFNYYGIIYYGMPSYRWTTTSIFESDRNMPNYWCVGNSITYCTITNCIQGIGDDGQIRIGQQDGMEIAYCYTEQPVVGVGSNCGGIKFHDDGYNKNTKIHDNTIIVHLNPSNRFNFAIEMWYELGGCEYYNNEITGSIDIDATNRGSSTYSVWIHDNNVGYPTYQSYNHYGINIEASCSDVIIERNYVHHVKTGLLFSMIWPIGDHVLNNVLRNIRISSNKFVNLGMLNGPSDWEPIYGINFDSNQPTSGIDTLENIYIWNNVFECNGAVTPNSYYVTGIWLPNYNTNTNNFRIQNNIIKGFIGGSAFSAPVFGTGLYGTTNIMTNLYIQNNIFVGNGNSNNTQLVSGYAPAPYYSNTPIKVDPNLNSIYEISSVSSSAYRTGIYVGLATDYNERAWNNPPSIGANEY